MIDRGCSDFHASNSLRPIGYRMTVAFASHRSQKMGASARCINMHRTGSPSGSSISFLVFTVLILSQLGHRICVRVDGCHHDCLTITPLWSRGLCVTCGTPP